MIIRLAARAIEHIKAGREFLFGSAIGP